VKAIGRAARFPLILKPMLPPTWSREPIATVVGHKKALTVHSAAELEARYGAIAALEPRLVVQDYVPGRDDRLYSLHVYMDRASEPLGWFTGRKLRTYPTYAGIGCFVESVTIPEIIADGIDMLRRIHYSGLALLQFKRDDRDGTYKLLEINPRTSSWNLLAAEAGVNLPYIAYRDAIGAPPQAPPVQRDGLRYQYFDHDLRAFWDYRKHGDITLAQWLGSLRGPKVYQLFAADDPSPFLHDLGSKGRRLLSRLTPGRPA
jgi:predicted ATP-grasp superfamily ATP-dependent carboligase